MVKVMITGHRPDKLGGYDNPGNAIELHVKEEIKRILEDVAFAHGTGNVELISGMALGADQWFAQIGLDMGMKVLPYIPFKGQDSRWKKEDQDTYKNLMNMCEDPMVISDRPSRNAFLERNSAMVQDADVAIAVWDGQYGSGTGSTVRKIQNTDMELFIIDPSGQ